MATVGNIVVNLLAGTAGFAAGMRQAQGMLDGFKNQVSSVAAQLAAVVGVTGGISSVGMGIKLAADAEQAAVSLEVMLGSAQDAKTLLEDLTTFAASTPFELPELQGATKQLIAFGVGQEDVLGTLRSLGDLASGLSIPLNDMALLYGTMKSQGKAMTQDLNQLAGRGIPIWTMLGDRIGVTQSQLRKMVEQGKIGFTDIDAVLKRMTSSGGQFFGMTERQSRTLSGLLSTLKDGIGAAFRGVGETIIEQLNVKEIIAQLSTITAWFGGALTKGVVTMIQLFQNWGKVIVMVTGFVIGFATGWKFVTFMIALSNGQLKLMAQMLAFIQSMNIWVLIGGLVVGLIALTGAGYLFDQMMTKLNEDIAAMEQAAADLQKKMEGISLEAPTIEVPDWEDPNAGDTLAKKAAQVMESVRTPYERYLQQMADLYDLVKAGVLPIRDYNLAVDQLAKTLDEATGGVHKQVVALEQEIAFHGRNAIELQAHRMLLEGANQAEVERYKQLAYTKEALESAQKAEEDRAKNLTDRTKAAYEAARSPMDEFRFAIMDMQELLANGLIDQRTFDLNALKARDELTSSLMASMPSAPGAALRGTSEAISAINQSRREDQQLRTLEDILAVGRRQVEILERRAAANTAELAAVDL